MRRPPSTHQEIKPNEKGGRTPPGPTPDALRSATLSVVNPLAASKGEGGINATKAIPSVRPASAIEPLLKLIDLARILSCDLRTIERLKSAGRLPNPDLLIGTGGRKSPRWKPATIRRWIDEGGAK